MNRHDAATHDRQAVFRSWAQEHAGLVYKVARAFASGDADRQDLIQEIFLQIWCSMPRFEGRAKVSTWIYRVALNSSLTWLRKETRRRTTQIPLIEVENLPSTEADGATQADRDEQVARLYEAIHRLPKVDAALVMLHLDGLSYREAGEVLGLSESNVGVKLTRARKALAESMKEVMHES